MIDLVTNVYVHDLVKRHLSILIIKKKHIYIYMNKYHMSSYFINLDTGIHMSTIVDGQDGEEEILELVEAACDYILTLMDSRDELIILKSSLQEQGFTVWIQLWHCPKPSHNTLVRDVKKECTLYPKIF